MLNRIRDTEVAKINAIYTWGYLLACHSGVNQTINCVRHFKPLFRWWNEDPSKENMCVPYNFPIAPPTH